jgi:hypothetical protein
MALKIVQTVNKLNPTASIASTSTGIALKSGYLRVSVGSTGAYVEIGNTPVVTVNSLHIPPANSEIIKERVARQVISGITTGTSTVITFGENAGNPFTTNDYVTIENAYPTGINTSHSQIISTTESSITISYNSSSIVGVAITGATVARSVKVAALGQGATSDVSITEVQTVASAY